LVKPYVKRGKNDGADAEALCEAMSRPSIRFVPVKTAEQQAALMMVGLRDRLIRNCTQLSNAIRGYAAEFGFSTAKGKAHLVPLLEHRRRFDGRTRHGVSKTRRRSRRHTAQISWGGDGGRQRRGGDGETRKIDWAGFKLNHCLPIIAGSFQKYFRFLTILR
jgi:transposase